MYTEQCVNHPTLSNLQCISSTSWITVKLITDHNTYSSIEDTIVETCHWIEQLQRNYIHLMYSISYGWSSRLKVWVQIAWVCVGHAKHRRKNEWLLQSILWCFKGDPLFLMESPFSDTHNCIPVLLTLHWITWHCQASVRLIELHLVWSVLSTLAASFLLCTLLIFDPLYCTFIHYLLSSTPHPYECILSMQWQMGQCYVCEEQQRSNSAHYVILHYLFVRTLFLWTWNCLQEISISVCAYVYKTIPPHKYVCHLVQLYNASMATK